MKPMRTVHDLIEEAKIRALYWALCIFAVTYFLTHTSKSMWLNFPLSLLLVCGLRLLLNTVEVHFRVERAHPQSYLSHLAKKQISIHDSRTSSTITPTRWKRKIDSPIVEAAILELVNKILQDFVTDLWYSEITPDNEAPELMRILILDALAEVAGRVKELNLVDLLTRDVIDLVGNHLDLFRRNQLAIGIDVMEILSTEERDERLKHHLINCRELHPALISTECEYKVLQQFSSGVLSVVLRPREAQCRLVRTIARELIASMILQPLMDLVSPVYINEVIENLFLQEKGNMFGGTFGEATDETCIHIAANNEEICGAMGSVGEHGSVQPTAFNFLSHACHENDPLPGQPGHWARGLNAANRRRTEVLMPENLDDMWSRGRNYTRNPKSMSCKGQVVRTVRVEGEEYMSENLRSVVTAVDEKTVDCLTAGIGGLNTVKPSCVDLGIPGDVTGSGTLRRSISASALGVTDNTKTDADVEGGRNNIILDFYGPEASANAENCNLLAVCHLEAHRPPNIKCRVVGAYFEKISSKSFAVYSIAVTDVENKTWFVKRRYRNFERLHRHLKDIPNYTLHLPPKRIFSSSTEDAFVHQRCIRLDKYLQDLLSIANVAEQHEVWDFLSSTSKNYSFGKAPSVMRTLAVNVDDAMDDIVRQFKGVGLVRKVSPSSSMDLNQQQKQQQAVDSANSASDGSSPNTAAAADSGWHSDNELNLKGLPPRVVKVKASPAHQSGSHHFYPDQIGSSVAVPPEWTPSKVSVPLLNLVDKVFQLKRRGWLRRQVFWMSKQIVQLMMEDAIDDFLLRQIHRIRQEDMIARAVRLIHDALWPDGLFYINSGTAQRNAAVSFQVQLETSRRANDIKKFIFDGPPAALVSLIGHKQYKRCAGDIYYFLQSTICLKQLMYAILELLLVSVFPELHDLVLDIHRKMPADHIS